jgi:Sigma-54 interaction domain
LHLHPFDLLFEVFKPGNREMGVCLADLLLRSGALPGLRVPLRQNTLPFSCAGKLLFQLAYLAPVPLDNLFQLGNFGFGRRTPLKNLVFLQQPFSSQIFPAFFHGEFGTFFPLVCLTTSVRQITIRCFACRHCACAGRFDLDFESADGGTLFLDELGLMPLTVQEKLLRVVEYGVFERVGSSETMDTPLVLFTAGSLEGISKRQIL